MSRPASLAVALVLGLAAGCGDRIEAPGTSPSFWSGRGAVLFTAGLSLIDSGEIRRIDVDGSGNVLLQPGTIPCAPRGNAIVVANFFPWRLSLAAAPGVMAQQVSLGSGRITAVAFSPAGDMIAYVLTPAGSPAQSDLYVVGIDGQGTRQVARDVVNSAYPVFSPDGKRIAYYLNKSQIALAVSQLSPSSQATTIAINARPWTVENIDWSPHGDSILYVGSERYDRHIWVARADGTSSRELSHGDGHEDRWPVWSHDGRSIAFIRDGEVWTMLANGDSLRQVTSGASGEYRIKMFPEWSPDGTMILFTAVGANGVRGLLLVVDLATLRVNALATDVARGFWSPPVGLQRRAAGAWSTRNDAAGNATRVKELR